MPMLDPEARRPMSPYIVCPRCGAVSHHPKDITERYCGRCHRFHSEPRSLTMPMIDRESRDPANPSREGKRLVMDILAVYVKDMINDGDYARLNKELLDVIRAERRLALRARG